MFVLLFLIFSFFSLLFLCLRFIFEIKNKKEKQPKGSKSLFVRGLIFTFLFGLFLNKKEELRLEFERKVD